MKCVDCGQEKHIENVYIQIYEKPICTDCVDYRENMILANQMKERFEEITK